MSFLFILSGISKVSVSLTVETKAVQNIFFLKDCQPLLLSVGFFTAALSVTVFESIMQMFTFMLYYPIYAFPFQTLISLVLWSVIEIKVRKQKRPVTTCWKNNTAVEGSLTLTKMPKTTKI